MIRFAYVFLLSFLLILAELLAESAGLRLLLFAPFVFYISYATDARTGCAAALLGGMVLDFCFGHANPWSAVFLLSAVTKSANGNIATIRNQMYAEVEVKPLLTMDVVKYVAVYAKRGAQ